MPPSSNNDKKDKKKKVEVINLCNDEDSESEEDNNQNKKPAAKKGKRSADEVLSDNTNDNNNENNGDMNNMNNILSAVRREREARMSKETLLNVRTARANSTSNNNALAFLAPTTTSAAAKPANATINNIFSSVSMSNNNNNNNNNSNEMFQTLVSAIMFQLHSRVTCGTAIQTLLGALGGGPFAPQDFIGKSKERIAKMMGQPSWTTKAERLIHLATEWETIVAEGLLPSPGNHVKNETDVAFIKRLKAIPGVGDWTIGELLMSLGRTDVLQTTCHEVKTGWKLLVQKSQRTQTLTAFVKHHHSLKGRETRVTMLLRDLHRSVQMKRQMMMGASRSSSSSSSFDTDIARAEQQLQQLIKGA